MSQPIITFLTDFGLEDNYVASMKGVVLTICREACLIDISHLVPTQDVRAGAFLLKGAYRYFPEGTIHLGIVDPGVGTGRKGLAIEAMGHLFVGPDNGLFSWVLNDAPTYRAFILEEIRYWRSDVSKTFHGRDIFAPVAAHLANGVPPGSFGPPCIPQNAEWSVVSRIGQGFECEVIYIDHFGNVVTNLTRRDVEGPVSLDDWIVKIGNDTTCSIVNTYGEQKPGSIVALLGSTGHLEIAVTQGNAAEILDIHVGTPVLVRRRHAAESVVKDAF